MLYQLYPKLNATVKNKKLPTDAVCFTPKREKSDCTRPAAVIIDWWQQTILRIGRRRSKSRYYLNVKGDRTILFGIRDVEITGIVRSPNGACTAFAWISSTVFCCCKKIVRCQRWPHRHRQLPEKAPSDETLSSGSRAVPVQAALVFSGGGLHAFDASISKF